MPFAPSHKCKTYLSNRVVNLRTKMVLYFLQTANCLIKAVSYCWAEEVPTYHHRLKQWFSELEEIENICGYMVICESDMEKVEFELWPVTVIKLPSVATADTFRRLEWGHDTFAITVKMDEAAQKSLSNKSDTKRIDCPWTKKLKSQHMKFTRLVIHQHLWREFHLRT